MLPYSFFRYYLAKTACANKIWLYEKRKDATVYMEDLIFSCASMCRQMVFYEIPNGRNRDKGRGYIPSWT